MKARFFKFTFPGLEKVHCVFTCRFEGSDSLAGDMGLPATGNGRSSRECLLRSLAKMGLDALAETNQVHGTELVIQPDDTGIAPNPADLPRADGMMSAAKNIGLLIRTADCQPILVSDGKHIMAIHAGWRGNRADFPKSAVERFCKNYDISAKNLFAVRGPSLGPASAQFVNFANEWPESFRPWLDEKSSCMDLWNLSRAQLANAGIPQAHIFGLDLCTLENREVFFSYRDNKCPGRQASVIWIS